MVVEESKREREGTSVNESEGRDREREGERMSEQSRGRVRERRMESYYEAGDVSQERRSMSRVPGSYHLATHLLVNRSQASRYRSAYWTRRLIKMETCFYVSVNIERHVRSIHQIICFSRKIPSRLHFAYRYQHRSGDVNFINTLSRLIQIADQDNGATSKISTRRRQHCTQCLLAESAVSDLCLGNVGGLLAGCRNLRSCFR